MQIYRTTIPQVLYERPQNEYAGMTCELEKGYIVTVFEEVSWIENSGVRAIKGVETLRCWLAMYGGKWGWVAAFDSEVPVGFDLIFDFAS